MSLFLLILGLLMFIGLVVLHEYGHFIMARRGGIDVEEFGVGFPPKAKTLKKHKGTEYTLNWLPLGGFVKLKGENDADTEPGSFGAASLPTKVKVMVAGVIMNLVAAFVILTFVALAGMPQLVENQYKVASDSNVYRDELVVAAVQEDSWLSRANLKVGDVIKSVDGENVVSPEEFSQIVVSANEGEYELAIQRDEEISSKTVKINPGLEVTDVTKGSPAEAAGLKKGDKIISVAGQELYSSNQLGEVTRENAGQAVEIEYINQSGETVIKNAELRDRETVQESMEQGESIGYLGVGTAGIPLVRFTAERSTWSAPIVAGGLMVQFTEKTLSGLGSAVANLFRGNTDAASQQVAGPLGIFVILRDSSLLGYQFVLFIIALISLTLAIMNILPIPALDGGRLFVTLLFHGLRKPLTKRAEDLIHGTGFALLMILFVLITVVDVKRFF